MSGLYLHIPFCKSRCHYCNFFSTLLAAPQRKAYTRTLCLEMEHRTGYLADSVLHTVYLGGGTPSLLSADELGQLFATMERLFHLAPQAEVTLEANPNDITADYVSLLADTPVNRISMGVQSFHDDTLRIIGRRHRAADVYRAVDLLSQRGYNISLDLIYGLPGQDLRAWSDDLREALSLPIHHLSAYALSYEEGTPLHRMLEQGLVEEADDETSLAMYELLIDQCEQAGLQQYEISNFARPGFHSRHNSSYWTDTPYLGVGAGAHSYDGDSRQWNPGDFEGYLRTQGDVEGHHFCEKELLTDTMKYNEAIMKGLRTRTGIPLDHFLLRLGEEACRRLLASARPHLERHLLELSRDPAAHLRLTRKGLFVSDGIISDLFLTD